MRRSATVRLLRILLCLPAVLAGCGEQPPAPPAAGAAPPPAKAAEPKPEPARPHRHPPTEFRIHEDSNDPDSRALREFAGQLIEAGRGDQIRLLALLQTALLDDAENWFKRVFGPDEGKRLSEQHAAARPHFANDVSFAFRRMAGAGLTEIHVYRLTGPADPRANEMQQAAFRAMKEPVDLYTVDFKNPNSSLGRSIFNWVKVGESFKLVGMLPGLP